MATWLDAVRPVPHGTRLLVEVAAGAKEARFPDGFNPWRDGRIGIRVRAPAEAGKANQEVVAAVAGFFAVPQSRVTLVQGGTDSRKTLEVHDLEPPRAIEALRASLGAP